MRADELNRYYHMAEHPENGTFLELDCGEGGADAAGRLPSGAIYYYVAPGEHTAFHRIDCGEYWCCNAGEPLELWTVDTQGKLSIRKLGLGEGCEPLEYFPAGVLFASRARKGAPDGTFLTCITVPHFQYEGFEMFDREYMIGMYPETAGFYEEWAE